MGMKNIRGAVETARRGIADLEHEVDRVVRELHEIKCAPRDRGELLRIILRDLAANADRGRQTLVETITRAQDPKRSNVVDLLWSGGPTGGADSDIMTHLMLVQLTAEAKTICGSLPQGIKDAVRAAEVKRLEAELAELRQLRDELRTDAA